MHTQTLTLTKETNVMKQLHQALVSHLQSKADDNTVVDLYNEYAEADDFIYRSIEEIAEVFESDDPTSLARMVYFGDVESWYARFFALDGYANIYSFNILTDSRSPVDFDWLAEQIIENEQFDAVGFDLYPYLSDDE